ncbi:antigen WC1.1-like [Apteryx mantelli]|uniref:Antigen WC1.1-like n=1 Tax=Apteryx mantelli TaxID=2696672 RepID=A0ABM4FIS9_9AVES
MGKEAMSIGGIVGIILVLPEDLESPGGGAAEVRLEAGGSRCAGRVEVKEQDQWGTVCGYGWDMEDAAVVCKQLGCGSALEAPRYGHFGPGSGPIWLSDLECQGTETALSECKHDDWRKDYCVHARDAGVVCSEPSESLWLVGRGSRCDGRVEMLLHGTWVRVLDDQWDVNDASVVCRQLQCGEAERAYNPPKPERGTGPVNGAGRCAGRVEIYYEGTWGTVCDDSWDLSDATVVCRQLGCGVAMEAPGSAHYGKGSGKIWLDEVNCSGGEAALWDCPAKAWGQHDCRHKEDAGVVCSDSALSCAAEVRLEAGDSRCAGRVEVKHQGQWGTVCDFGWDMEDAAVVCKQLGCGSALQALEYAHFGPGSGQIWLSWLRCTGTETALSECSHHGWGKHNCYHAEDAGVVCSGKDRRVRLVNGTGRCAGRVEIYYKGTWGTVCDNSWDLSDATVVCHQLGCGVAMEAPGSAHYGEGSGQIWLDEVNCSGGEAALWDCPAGAWGQHDCRHKEDAGVVCSEFTALRLEKSNGCSGRLQVFYNGTWGSVCSNSMTPDTMSLVCKELGCGDEGFLETDLPYGRISGSTWLDRVECGKMNSSFWQCPSAPWKQQSCYDQREETRITCSEMEKIRAVGGEDGCSGRVEVWHRGSWGTVCDGSWDMKDAEVACRQLGCGPAVSALRKAAFGKGTGPIWLERVECRGTEQSLWDCCTQPGDSGACQHKEDAAVNCSGFVQLVGGDSPCSGRVEIRDGEQWRTVCDSHFGVKAADVICRELQCGTVLSIPGAAHFGEGRVRLVNRAGRCAGRVEIYYEGTWGTVCDDSWDLSDATVVCRQMGCGVAVEVTSSARYGEGCGQIWLDEVNCSGGEAALWDCPARAWGQHDCMHKEDAGVVCSEFTALRLEKSDGCSGRLQVFYNGTWGSVCSNSMTPDTMSLVCKELGCGDEGSLEADLPYGRVSGPTWLDHVECGKMNSSFWQCPSAPWKLQSCYDQREETRITCSGIQLCP